MQQSIVKFTALSRRRCSTCFGHYCAHHQEHLQTAIAASGFRMNVEVDVFPAGFGLSVGQANTHCLPTNNQPRLEIHPPPHSYGNQRLRRQFEGDPDDGHSGARNMLSSVYATKQ
jgi:hypothetical protein